jgi:putative ABC transport system permease protein
MRAINRKLLRDLWHIRGQGLAISLVIACGVATVVMSFGTLNSLIDTRDAYYERYRFAHVFAGLKRAPEHIIAQIARIPGVARAESRIVSEVTLDVPGMAEPVNGRLISLPDRGQPMLDGVALRLGRRLAPGSTDEAIIDEAFAEAHGLGPGDRIVAIINGHRRNIVIVGIALSPEYIYAIGEGQLVPDNRRFGILWMARDALAAAYDLKGSFNDVALTLQRSASEAAVIARLDDILEPYGGVGAYARADQRSHSFLANELDQLLTIGWIIPPIFLGVAAFLLNIVVSRLIETEREQIGLFKALGYTDLEVGWLYLKLVLILVLIGVTLGALGGVWAGRMVTEIYAEFYRFPFLHYRADPGVFAAAAVISVGSATLGTLGVLRRAVILPPAVAMAPPTPPVYRRGLLEGFLLSRRVGEPTRMIFRHITRWPARAALTVLGISMSGAILVASVFIMDGIDHLIRVHYFLSQRQDISVAFTEPRTQRAIQSVSHLPGVVLAEPYRTVAVRIRSAHRSERVVVTGLPRDSSLRRLIDKNLQPVAIPPSGVVVTSKLADLLGVTRGDLITVEALEGKRPITQIRVAMVVEEFIGISAYMDIAALNRMMREGPVISGVDLQVDSLRRDALFNALKSTPAGAGLFNKIAAVRKTRETIGETMNIMVSFYVLFAGLIAFGVIYNTARIALSEFGRELASLRVLGFTRGEVSYILLGELTVLTLLSLPLGCAIGYGLAWNISRSLDTELFRVPLVVDSSTYGLAVLVVVVSALVSGLIVRRRIDHLDLIAVLKTRE